MKMAVPQLKAKLASKSPVNTRKEESPEEEPHLEDVGQDLEADEERGPEPPVVQTFNDEEDSTEIKFINGNKGAKNSGKIILGTKQKFIFKSWRTYKIFYTCTRKHESQGKGRGATCGARLSIEMNEVEEEVDLLRMPS